jgi:ankyrin repeat protein
MHYLENELGDFKINQIIDKDGYSLLHTAAFKNRTRIVQALLKKAKRDLY